MAMIENLTRKPLKVPLPGGKKLHLAPLKTGEVQPKALEHPALLKMVEAGELRIVSSARGSGGSSGGGRKGAGSPKSNNPGGARFFQSGDR